MLANQLYRVPQGCHLTRCNHLQRRICTPTHNSDRTHRTHPRPHFMAYDTLSFADVRFIACNKNPDNMPTPTPTHTTRQSCTETWTQYAIVRVVVFFQHRTYTHVAPLVGTNWQRRPRMRCACNAPATARARKAGHANPSHPTSWHGSTVHAHARAECSAKLSQCKQLTHRQPLSGTSPALHECSRGPSPLNRRTTGSQRCSRARWLQSCGAQHDASRT